MKKAIKLINVLLVAIILTMTLSTVVMATEAVNPENIAGSLTGTQSNAQGQITSIGNQIIGIITTIGVVVAVIVLLILGIKYMMGSASEKAEYKKTMIPYLVGAVLIFGASAITKVVVSVSAGLTSGTK